MVSDDIPPSLELGCGEPSKGDGNGIFSNCSMQRGSIDTSTEGPFHSSSYNCQQSSSSGKSGNGGSIGWGSTNDYSVHSISGSLIFLGQQPERTETKEGEFNFIGSKSVSTYSCLRSITHQLQEPKSPLPTILCLQLCLQEDYMGRRAKIPALGIWSNRAEAISKEDRKIICEKWGSNLRPEFQCLNILSQDPKRHCAD
ncbi:hypothetical protein BDZ91DRAFT_745773 [Kalaharituber pfeilii]|nr:hypothetical protein BDZ91DRAFT_745773 [Kalaharituber pfeilii]